MNAKRTRLIVAAIGIVVSVLLLSVAIGWAQNMTQPASSQPASAPAGKTTPATAPSTDKAVNNRCPIMGNKVDPDNVPVELTRQYKGQKIGFCCAMCPAKWDKLSDVEKDKKLSTVLKTAKSPQTAPSGHEGHGM